MDLITIIIPCYNAEAFICQTLDSVKQQTYKNWECIIINDGSTDNSEKKIASVIKDNHQFKLINQDNSGLSETRNSGIDLANGSYIYFLDADDLLNEETLESLHSKFNDVTDIVFGKTALTHGQNTKITGYLDHGLSTNKLLSNQYLSLLNDVLEYPTACIACNKLYRLAFLKSHQLKFKKNILHEDELWFFETLFYSRQIVSSDKVTYYYNKHNSESITNNFTLKNVESYIFILDFISTNYLKSPLDRNSKTSVLQYLAHLEYITIIHCYASLKNETKKAASKLIQEAFDSLNLYKTSKEFSFINKYKEFLKVTHLNASLMLKFVKYQHSKKIMRQLKKQIILKYAKLN